ncbi:MULTISPECIES: helix-turn-helix domain-containing protein [Pseudovibrio]|uniref:helix-turn-helix domain-containing protein n=1 Tax=Stappiaceae TaxID=2821832 RepID=UPI0023659596|nr:MULTISPECIES: helix-turn-helix transcriptional regulator [Pseudovibrio]MDD7911650.1 helix-turn-helix transcriptional regulator [Pseudovibrio exalbescens]MDX5594386.1 helix-turn-helix transcriptional regulator [Pseudovibrio sp. SPO723]
MNAPARTPEQLGTVIRNARKAQNLSQNALAQRVGVRQGTISQIETGHAALRLETLLSVLAALNLELQVATRSKGSMDAIEDLF